MARKRAPDRHATPSRRRGLLARLASGLFRVLFILLLRAAKGAWGALRAAVVLCARALWALLRFSARALWRGAVLFWRGALLLARGIAIAAPPIGRWLWRMASGAARGTAAGVGALVRRRAAPQPKQATQAGDTASTVAPPPRPGPARGGVLAKAVKSVRGKKDSAPAMVVAASIADEDVPLARTSEVGGWRLPAIDVLDKEPARPAEKVDNDGRARSIEQALASYGIDGAVVEINPGPAVTQFGIEPGWVRKYRETKVRDENGKFVLDDNGNPVVNREEVSRTRVKVDAISNLDRDLAMALAVPSVRIEAPIPGKAMVGLEVPNTVSETVTIRSGITSIPFQKLREKTKLGIVLGKGSGGQPEVADLAKMPHLLVAGTTGSGKSIGLRAILVSLLMQCGPRELRLMLIDPKRVELVAFNGIPHLIGPVIVDVEKVVDALRWAVQEMEERYKKLAAVGARNLDGYNRAKEVIEPLPYLLIMIDELADLMMAAPMDVEHCIIRLAQLGRATGIHLVAATQRPSVNVVTGLIKANFPTRISFAVSSLVDSRTILDSAGAEKLLGKGDMLYLPQDAPKPKRIQGVYVADAEVERVVRAWSQQRPPGPPVANPLAPAPPAGSKPEDHAKPMAAIAGPASAGAIPAFAAVAAAASRAAVTPAAHDLLNASPMATSPAAIVIQAPRPVEKDPLMPKAREIAAQHKKISASLLQRKLKVGYNKAAHLMELLEEEGYGQGDEDDVF